MRVVLLVVAVTLFGPDLAAGQGAASVDTLAGRVVDRDGQGLADATVLVAEAHRVTTTGPDGAFGFPGVQPGRYTVVVRRVGYAAHVGEVEVGTGPVELTLLPAAVQVEAVTVTATRQPIDALGSPLPVAGLSGDRLRRTQSVSLARALETLAGVRTLSTGESIGKPMIRGLAGARVLALVNGSRLEDYSWSDEDGPSVDPRLAERIEVIRGPASVLYGSDALGGVVNVIPAELPDANGGPAFARSGLELSGATNNAELGGALRVEGASGRLGWRATAIGRHAADLHTPAGELDNTGFGALSGEAAVGLRGSRGGAALRYARYGGEFKLLEANGPPAPATGEAGPERRLADDRVQLAGDYRLGTLRLEAKGQWQRHSLIEVSDEGGGTPGQEATAFDLLLNTGTLDVLLHHPAGPRVRGTIGASGLYQTNDTRGPIPLVPAARVRAAALFAFEQATLGRWSLLAGGRVDARHLGADSNAALGLSPQTRDYVAWSANVGFVYRPLPSLALAANLGRAWRAPTLFELFANGPHVGEARYEVGRSTLRPEAAANLDVSARWQGGRVSAEVAGYRNAIGRYIFLAPTSNTVGGLRVYDYDQADAVLAGMEASLEALAWPVVTIGLRGDATWGTNRSTDEPLPSVPAPRAAVSVELHSAAGAWSGRPHVGIEAEFVGRQTRLNPLDIPTAGYTLLNVDAGAEARFLGRAVRVDLTVRNAADASYRDFLSRYKEFALNPGRNVIVRVSTAP